MVRHFKKRDNFEHVYLSFYKELSVVKPISLGAFRQHQHIEFRLAHTLRARSISQPLATKQIQIL